MSIPEESMTDDAGGDERGIALLELLVAVGLTSLIGVAVAYSAMLSLRTAKFTEVNHAATSLAISRMEELAAIDTLDLDGDNSETESAVAWPDLGFTFTRVTTVSVNGDDSRTVEVSVSSNDGHLPTTVNLRTTLAVWE